MCYCNPSFDIRCTCWVENNDGTINKDFLKCPQRHDTTYERIMNEYDYYKKIEKNGFDSIKNEILNITKLTHDDWIIIKDIYDEINKEDSDDEDTD
jgi:hypothetical protein